MMARAPTRVQNAWSAARTARAAFLAGRGHTLDEIAADGFVEASPKAISVQLGRVGISLRSGSVVHFRNLPREVRAAFDEAAGARHVTTETLMRRLLIVLGREPNLINSVLDDGQ